MKMSVSTIFASLIPSIAAGATVSPAMYDLARDGVRDRGALSSSGGSASMTHSAFDANGGYSLQATVSPALTTISMSYAQYEGDRAPSSSVGARLDMFYRIDPLPGAPAVSRVPLRIAAGGYVSISGNVKGQISSSVYGDFAGEYVYIGGLSLNASWTLDRSSASLEDSWAGVSTPTAPIGSELTISVVTDGFLQTPSGYFGTIPAGSGELHGYTDPQVTIDSSYEYASFFTLTQSSNVPEPAVVLIGAVAASLALRRRRQ